MRVALDSNILCYLAGVDRHPDDKAKSLLLAETIGRLQGTATVVVAAQALGETFVVLRRAGAGAERAKESIERFDAAFLVAPSRRETLRTAADLATRHALQFWDSVIITACVEAGCAVLLSEDMQDGFSWSGLTIVNPLEAKLHPRFTALLA